MKRIAALFCACLFLSSFTFAQTTPSTDSDIDQEKPEDKKTPVTKAQRLNEPGDQFIKLGLMMTMPLNFGGTFPLYRDGKMATGGAGEIGYHRFITSWFAFGADVSFGYNPTIGENVFTYIPLIINVTVQPTIKRFEFPITIGAGAAVENYLNKTYFPGFVLKPQVGVFYRATPTWSFGIEGEYLYMPQWYSNSSNNDYGCFASIAVSARYHF